MKKLLLMPLLISFFSCSNNFNPRTNSVLTSDSSSCYSFSTKSEYIDRKRNRIFIINTSKNFKSFFISANDDGKINYFKNGKLSFNPKGYLKTSEGNYVLGLFSNNKKIVNQDKLTDFNKVGKGIDIDFTDFNIYGNSPNFSSLEDGEKINFKTIFSNFSKEVNFIISKYIDENGINDRVLGKNFVPSGTLLTKDENGNYTKEIIESDGGFSIGKINGESIFISISEKDNNSDRTSFDNAVLFAKAINVKSDKTGVGASVVVNMNDNDQATLVLGHINRVISFSSGMFPINPTDDDIESTLVSNKTGLIKTFRDSDNNLLYSINVFSLDSNRSSYFPELSGSFTIYEHDLQMANFNKKNIDDYSIRTPDLNDNPEDFIPPFETGVKVALTRFENSPNLSESCITTPYFKEFGKLRLYTKIDNSDKNVYLSDSETGIESIKQSKDKSEKGEIVLLLSTPDGIYY